MVRAGPLWGAPAVVRSFAKKIAATDEARPLAIALSETYAIVRQILTATV